MKANPDKFQFIILGNTLQIGNITIKSIIIDSKLNFKEHINNIVKKHIIDYIRSEDYEIF